MGLGIAFHSLRLWVNSLQYLKLVTDDEDDGIERWGFLGTACMETMDYAGAIEAFSLHTEKFPTQRFFLEKLASASIAKGNLESAILTLENELEIEVGFNDLLPAI